MTLVASQLCVCLCVGASVCLCVLTGRCEPAVARTTKFTLGAGLSGSMRTTRLSTLGGGRKLFFPTFISWSTRDSSCVLTDSRQYSSSPGLQQMNGTGTRTEVNPESVFLGMDEWVRGG